MEWIRWSIIAVPFSFAWFLAATFRAKTSELYCSASTGLRNHQSPSWVCLLLDGVGFKASSITLRVNLSLDLVLWYFPREVQVLMLAKPLNQRFYFTCGEIWPTEITQAATMSVLPPRKSCWCSFFKKKKKGLFFYSSRTHCTTVIHAQRQPYVWQVKWGLGRGEGGWAVSGAHSCFSSNIHPGELSRLSLSDADQLLLGRWSGETTVHLM